MLCPDVAALAPLRSVVGRAAYRRFFTPLSD
jgi:hypothetical protein